MQSFVTADFDFDLPPELIAQRPAERRDGSRLLVLDRSDGSLCHRQFPDLVGAMPPGDVLVLNETRVFPARLCGTRGGGGAAEVLLLRPENDDETVWRALVRPGARLRAGRSVFVSPELAVEIEEVLPSGERRVRLQTSAPVRDALERWGQVPLPPYIDRAADGTDQERYQTVYAAERGSVAAPTAGLHFTPDLLNALEQRGVEIARVVLHVGVGTFRPVEHEDPAQHPMHEEEFYVPAEAAERINAARRRGGKVWAVGTTVARTLESVAAPDGTIPDGRGWTDLFIRPPYRFRAIDRLLTNFHLPRSTLMMLVSAFGGYDHVMEAYRAAVAGRYRFFSYGDAMLIRD